MISLVRTNSSHIDFARLIIFLDKELKIRDGDDHEFYDQFNQIQHIQHVVLAYENDEAIGCGAIKHFDETTMEVKRMFVPLAKRNHGIASRILKALETWTIELGYKKCILETGIKQPEAIQLYTKNHYALIPNYGQYEGVEQSVCFEKWI